MNCLALRISSIAVLILAAAGCAAPVARDSATAPTSAITSGLQPGDDIIPWNPIHVAGPNKGTNACPVCTYEARPAVVIFARSGPDLPGIATRLQQLVERRQASDLKGFLIVLDESPQQLAAMADELKLTHIGVCYPDPATRDHDLKAYRISPSAGNTVIVYKDYKVAADFVDVTPADFARVETAVAKLP
jgi:protocatechuate 3,4-dioxygenase beta subunit